MAAWWIGETFFRAGMSGQSLISRLGMRGVLAVFLILCIDQCAVAAMYRISVGGTVMLELMENVTRLDPFTLRFTVDSDTSSGNSEERRYLASPPTIAFPRITIATDDSDVNVLAVAQNNCDYCLPRAMLGYTSWGRTFSVEMRLHFPHDTFTPDEIPLALDPTDAYYAKLFVYRGDVLGTPLIQGNVTSYNVVVLPEPLTSALSGFGLIFLLPRHCKIFKSGILSIK